MGVFGFAIREILRQFVSISKIRKLARIGERTKALFLVPDFAVTLSVPHCQRGNHRFDATRHEAFGERLAGSLALHSIGTLHGACIIRTHDVMETCDAVAVAWAAREAQSDRT